jgi:hypothetical protein
VRDARVVVGPSVLLTHARTHTPSPIPTQTQEVQDGASKDEDCRVKVLQWTFSLRWSVGGRPQQAPKGWWCCAPDELTGFPIDARSRLAVLPFGILNTAGASLTEELTCVGWHCPRAGCGLLFPRAYLWNNTCPVCEVRFPATCPVQADDLIFFHIALSL